MPSPGEESASLRVKPLSLRVVEELLSLQPCTDLVFQERRGVEDVFEDGCGLQPRAAPSLAPREGAARREQSSCFPIMLGKKSLW